MATSKKNTKDVENTAHREPQKVYGTEGLGLLLADMAGKEYRTPTDPPRGCVTEGRDLVPAITELIREGKVCMYKLLLSCDGMSFVGGDGEPAHPSFDPREEQHDPPIPASTWN